ncbi:unnamed protein product [Cylicocyclus nassatus]|uniref:7TM GPCR serpentine receptor class x (Srx) domain-containing protein n=1 Tax=Cylicocyclus nassatus TaxID=53992 RepID=A0AA36MBI3_CYLNA|nr:unnamed protein product [Cylicocyclus nassatus]
MKGGGKDSGYEDIRVNDWFAEGCAFYFVLDTLQFSFERAPCGLFFTQYFLFYFSTLVFASTSALDLLTALGIYCYYKNNTMAARRFNHNDVMFFAQLLPVLHVQRSANRMFSSQYLSGSGLPRSSWRFPHFYIYHASHPFFGWIPEAMWQFEYGMYLILLSKKCGVYYYTLMLF